MRILVVSDSHGDEFRIRRAIEQQPTAELMFFLGDGVKDIDYINVPVPVIKVRGNCDWSSDVPEFSVDEVNGVRIYSTHGYAEHVKYDLSSLQTAAVEHGAHIALYGHTHFPVTKYIDGIWYINPGSIKEGNFAVVDIKPSGILPTLMKIRY